MGSGASVIAALNRGREFIGIEIEQQYWLEAQQRVFKKCHALIQVANNV